MDRLRRRGRDLAALQRCRPGRELGAEFRWARDRSGSGGAGGSAGRAGAEMRAAHSLGAVVLGGVATAMLIFVLVAEFQAGTTTPPIGPGYQAPGNTPTECWESGLALQFSDCPQKAIAE